MRTKVRGFTLIELMIAVAIVGILASIAVPSYLEHVRKGKRSEAQGALVSFANAMEQWRLQKSNYLGAATGGGDTGAPTIFSAVVPISGGTITYNLTISAVTATTYTLTATAAGTQAADGNLTLTHDGTKRCTVASACLHGLSW
ncbi:MAG: type IV pilin protein [Methylobacter sp.]|jgi:type IV pilus assembly protein PilE